MDALINHPAVGSVWLLNIVAKGTYIEGTVYEENDQPFEMNFPVRCIRKLEGK